MALLVTFKPKVFSISSPRFPVCLSYFMSLQNHYTLHHIYHSISRLYLAMRFPKRII